MHLNTYFLCILYSKIKYFPHIIFEMILYNAKQPE
jgi:hypothetical protein